MLYSVGHNSKYSTNEVTRLCFLDDQVRGLIKYIRIWPILNLLEQKCTINGRLLYVLSENERKME